jgi:hypothetical protein
VTKNLYVDKREDAPVAATLTGKILSANGCTAAFDRVPFRAGDERPGGETDGCLRPGEHVGTYEQEWALRP